ncbi:hypothetical protein SDC9_196578 [bioreactor metagenome]|uniref:DUF4342 domain-containing protein n=1 Tax=bioreactor metagenome TaxID=1076179 RepID=A0A645ICE6_9ZZZZ
MEEITLEKIDIIRERIGVSYKEAKDILERNRGNVIEALVDAENKKQSSWTEEFSVRSNEVMDKVKELIHEGNVNRIRIKSDGRTLVEIPVAIGAIGAVVLPQLAALGVLVAVFKRCTIEVIRTGEEDPEEFTPEKKDSDDTTIL